MSDNQLAELAKVRDAEALARKAADDMFVLAASLESILAGGEPVQPQQQAVTVAQTPNGQRWQATAPRPQAFGSGSHSDAFRRAMAGRKLTAI